MIEDEKRKKERRVSGKRQVVAGSEKRNEK